MPILKIKKMPAPTLVGKQYFDPNGKRVKKDGSPIAARGETKKYYNEKNERVKKDGSPIARKERKSEESKKVTKLVTPINKQLVKIERNNPKPIADAALRSIGKGISMLLNNEPIMKPKKEGPKKERKLTEYQKWYKKFVKTNEYAILRMTYPDQPRRMKAVGEAWRQERDDYR
jgi:hypothetical protein